MKKLVFVSVLLMLTATAVYAGNVDTYGIGSKATALGGAYSAYANDPYAAYYNPAGLANIDGKIGSLGIMMIDPTINISNYRVSNTNDPQIKGPKNFSDESPNLYPPHVGYAMPISNNVSLGIAAYVPWGLEIEWEKDPAKNPGAYNYFHSYFIREVASPTIAYKINNNLSFGFGLSIGKTTAGEERKLYVSPDIGRDPVLAPAILSQTRSAIAQVQANNPGVVPTITTFTQARDFLQKYAPTKTAEISSFNSFISRGADTPEQLLASYAGQPAKDHGAHVEASLDDNFNYSFNLGVMYRPIESLILGLTYRSRTSVSLSGDVQKEGKKVGDATLEYDHPEQVQVGIRYVPQSYKDLSIEFDLVWTRWSVNDIQSAKLTGLQVEIADGLPKTEIKDSTYRRNWENTNQIRIGVEWKVTDIVTLRGGYFYDPSPIPDDTLDLMWPDADKKTYSLGCGLNFGKFSIDTVIQYSDIEKARYIGGESESFNKSYEGTYSEPNSRQVSLSADGYLWGVGVTFKVISR